MSLANNNTVKIISISLIILASFFIYKPAVAYETTTITANCTPNGSVPPYEFYSCISQNLTNNVLTLVPWESAWVSVNCTKTNPNGVGASLVDYTIDSSASCYATASSGFSCTNWSFT